MTTVWQEFFAGSNFAIFAVFPAMHKSKFPPIKITANIYYHTIPIPLPLPISLTVTLTLPLPLPFLYLLCKVFTSLF